MESAPSQERLLAIIDAELAKLDDTPDPQERLAIVQEAQRQVAADLSTLLTLLPPELV